MSNEKTIRGRIIRILDTETVIINLGQQHDITGESTFRILANPEPIIDPLTSEELGTVSIVKGRLKASRVYDRFTIAKSKWMQAMTRASIAITDLVSDIAGVEVDERGDDLRVLESDLKPWLAESEEPVRVGDEVEVSVSAPADEPQPAIEATSDERDQGEDAESPGHA